MACGNARREAYTAGGEVPLLNLEICNDDAFILVIVGAGSEAPVSVRRHGSSGVEERIHSHRIACQGTWEVLPCPWETDGRKGNAGRKQ